MHTIAAMASTCIRSRFSLVPTFSRARQTPLPRVPFQPFPYRFVANMHTVPKLNDESLLISKAFVNGEFVDAASGSTFDVHDPGTGKKIGTCPDFNKQDTENAIAAASEALISWRKTLPRERATLLRKWYDEMQKNAADIATLITWEVSQCFEYFVSVLIRPSVERQAPQRCQRRSCVCLELLPLV